MAASGGLRMTEDLLKAKSGQFDLESIQWLDLTGCGIARMENLAQLTSLQELRLGRNNLKEISDLGEKPRLSYLDLSDNKLSGLSGLSGLTSLTSLRLEGNKISDVKEINKLLPLTSLKHLWLSTPAASTKANPVCAHPSYTAVVMRTLPSLEMIDGEHMILREKAQKALVDSVQIDEKEIEASLPPSAPWTEGVDMEPPMIVPDVSVKRKEQEFEKVAAEVADLEAKADKLLRRLGHK